MTATLVRLTIDPLAGPACESNSALGGCYHDSCAEIECTGRIAFTEGPVCAAADYLGECPHASCEAREPAQGWCGTHNSWQLLRDCGSGRGFAGGTIYWATLACGCTDMDESDDIRAAY
jgi:hypothetical protein